MTEFLLLAAERDESPTQARAVLEARARFTAELHRMGAFLDTEQLRPSSEAVRISNPSGTPIVVRGPFTNAIGTYWVLRADDAKQASELAARLPLGGGEQLELRPVMKGAHAPAKTDAVGKVFAFGVLGNAPNEAAWTRVMDAIDADTQDGFGEAFIAGVRLEAPSTGRLLTNQHGKPVTLDGPFLESKEVIGGFFFMRFAGFDDAVAWASTTAFARRGTIEVREVWRA
ncbi:MAG: YciI family protein [Archangium sp.]